MASPKTWVMIATALLAGPALGQEVAAPAAEVAASSPELAALTPAPAPALPPVAAEPGEARYVGEAICANCHDSENGLFGHTQHAKAFRENPHSATEEAVCEACHGPGSLHALDTHDKKKIIGFSREWGTPTAVQNAQCLNCHSGGQRIHWPDSIHAVNKLACSDCHNPMERFSTNGLLKKPNITEVCLTCHQQQRAEFRKRSHMPVLEGKMSCEDCHNPHGSSTKTLLKADSINELCYACHAEKRGPFIWEHAPVRENCLNCHNPHGSNQDKLLVQARPMLCQQCHSGQGGMGHQLFGANTLATNMADLSVTAANVNAGSRRTIGRSCQNCHSQIHGSNSPSGARFQR